ncbi:MAG: hypothetical protein HEQ16_14390 [Bosea sp.]|jgi:flagellar motility protein MotE (MotC chaperone)|nr:hypothetical protein [Bosea sp. (in: a-proteobacteria)]
MATRHERFCAWLGLIMIDRRRLIPAVILGAMGLLALKAMSWLGLAGSLQITPLAEQVAPRTAIVQPDGSYNPSDFRGMTQMFARAREPYFPDRVDVTGSVPAKPPQTSAAQAPAGATPATAPAMPEPPFKDRAAVMNESQRTLSSAERALAERLGERRDAIEARQRELDMREKLLETAERKLDGRVGELKAVEEKLDGKKDEKESAESQGLKKLVIMYENMKPKDAARVFDRLPADVLVPMVLQMNPRKMSEVMASMSSESAEKLTVALALRARARTEPTAAAAAAPAGSNELQAIAPAAPASRP